MQESEQEITLKTLFVPFTSVKAVFWILIFGIIVFGNMLFNGFVWDDISQIVTNPSVHSLSNVWSFFFGTYDIHGNLVKIPAIYYRPLMASLFAFVYTIFGPGTFFFHVLSLVMHIGISVILFFVFLRFFKQGLAFFLTIIFLVHPLNSEVVNYISAYNDLLYMLFGMIEFFLIQKTISLRRIGIASVFLFLSVLSKETGFLFLPIIFMYTVFYHRKYLFSIVLSLISVALMYILLRTTFYTGVSQNGILGFSSYLHMSLLQHIVNIPKIFFYYLGNFFFPNSLAIAQHWSVQNITVWDFYIPLVFLILFLGGNVYLLLHTYRQKEIFKEVVFFSVWFWVGILLYLQFIPLDMTVADRWFYFPMVGLLGLIGISASAFLSTNAKFKKAFFVIAVICITCLGIRTMIRNINWRDELTLYTHDMKIAQRSFDLENQLGIVLFRNGEVKAATVHFEKSIALWNCSQALGNLGYVYEVRENTKKAEEDLRKSIDCSGEYKSFGNLIILLYNENKLSEAAMYAKKGIALYPNSAGLYFLLGVTEYQLGNKTEAIKDVGIGAQMSHDTQIINTLTLMQHNQPISKTISL